MTLTDAGPLVAIIDADESDHEACLETLDGLTLPMVTTWPAFTEAMYLLGRAGGLKGQQALWRLVQTDRLVVANLSPTAVERSARLMGQYADRPMDLARRRSSPTPKKAATAPCSPSIPTLGSIASAAASGSRRSLEDDGLRNVSDCGPRTAWGQRSLKKSAAPRRCANPRLVVAPVLILG